MNHKRSDLQWPEELEEVEIVHLYSGEPMSLDDLRSLRRSAIHFDADAEYVRRMQILCDMAKNEAVLLALSDGVTNHVVIFRKLYVEARQYIIVYLDIGSSERGTFLQEGKNVAGVKAKRYGTDPQLWAVSHDEFFRVLDSVLIMKRSNLEDKEEGS